MSNEISREEALKIIEIAKSQRQSFGDNEELDLEDVNDMNVEQLVFLRDQLDMISKDVRATKSFIDQRLRGVLKNKAFRMAGRIFRGRNVNKWVPYDKDKVLDYLGEDLRHAVNPQFRTSAIKAIAKERNQNPSVIMESLFELQETTNLEVLPIDKAPKFIKESLDTDGKEMTIGGDNG